MADMGTNATEWLATDRIIDAEFARETHIKTTMDRLHRVFADQTDEPVVLSKLTLDDFALSTELLDAARELLNEGIDLIPASEERRQDIAYTTATLG